MSFSGSLMEAGLNHGRGRLQHPTYEAELAEGQAKKGAGVVVILQEAAVEDSSCVLLVCPCHCIHGDGLETQTCTVS